MSLPPVRLGIIGVGGMARHHIGQIVQIPGVTITALCDTNPAQIDKAKEKFPEAVGDAAVSSDYRDLLARDDVDAVLIATPHTQHFQQAMDTVDAGKHLLLEKPMVCRVEDAHALLKRIEDYDKVVALAYQRHAAGPFKHMKQMIDSGEVGAVTYIAALQCQGWKKGCAGTWRHDPALSGGGQINDSGSHLLDIILWVSGLTVAEVTSFMDNCGTPVDINSAVSMRFTNGAQGTITIVGDSVASWHEDITIWCEKGVFFYRNGALEYCDAEGKRHKLESADMPEGQNIDQNFIGAIRGENPVGAPPLCGLRTIELTEAAWKSAAQQGTPIKMN